MCEQATKDSLKRLMAGLEREPRVDLHHFPIRASVQDGRLILEGVVGDIAAKRVAVRLAHEAAGEWPVDDRLQLDAETVQDDELGQDIENALLQEPVFTQTSIRRKRGETIRTLRDAGTSSGIDCEVSEGVVSLSGAVGSLSHRRLAEVLAWWASGCKAVVNELRVEPPERDDDAEIQDALRMIWEKDPLVHADQLRASVRDGVATLSGSVASREEQRLAVLDAWYVAGISDVIDTIQARS